MGVQHNGQGHILHGQAAHRLTAQVRPCDHFQRLHAFCHQRTVTAQRGDDSPRQPESCPLNINTATAGQLETLDGIGQVLAQRIVDYRNANGPFASVDDLLEVNGIGPGILETIRPQITTEEEP